MRWLPHRPKPLQLQHGDVHHKLPLFLKTYKQPEKVLAIPGMVCRSYMDAHPELVKNFLTDNQAYLQDVDTRADIQKLGIESI
jgi:hypothetical protein